ncbi:phosphoribosyl-dephospho-CoA transferase [Undibacterium sp. YM2]|uniref:malonate decarboxylase holo-[acyl-carrier-protein] synthase n=1 Tax=Undibacterium sp. YM2 TaxID=2058625 RepID=UPI001331F2C2|nr:malonate decarboxylase holo-[acyl-carrier-protein] synthase [Undibacterium sp. YM2]BBB64630.1 phosphoribosyl-dephospho-CoA transferase [Undibacterium sp. YM2]
MDSIAHYQRHDLVWLADEAWLAVLQSFGAPDLLRQWQQEEWPAVVTRRHPDAANDEVCIGFPLPPVYGNKPRFAAKVKAEHIAIHQSALSLHTVVAVVPPAWQAGLQSMHQQALMAGIKLRVYGSVAMQFLTGQDYLSTTSDIDILFRPYHQAQLRAGLALLQEQPQTLPIDGEIAFPGEAAVAWKEWIQPAHPGQDFNQQRVMVKDMHGVSLRTRQSLLELLAEGELPC